MFIYIYLIVFAIYSDTLVPVLAQSYRSAFGHGVPVKNVKLSVTPLNVIAQASALACTRHCLERDWCRSFNYKRNVACELLDTFLCEGANTLTPEDGYSYYDVEVDESPEVCVINGNEAVVFSL